MSNLIDLIIKKKSEKLYKITRKDIEKEAKLFFKECAGYQLGAKTIFSIIGDHFHEHWDNFLLNSAGIPNIIISQNYHESVLENIDFWSTCFYKIVIKKIIKKTVDVGTAQMYIRALMAMLNIKYKDDVGFGNKLLKIIDIDMKIVHPEFRKYLLSSDEYYKANKIIKSSLNNIKKIDSGFINYDNYYEYVKKEVKKIIETLIKNEMFYYRNEEKFTLLVINHINSISDTAEFYVMNDHTNDVFNMIPEEQMKKVQKQLLEYYLGGMNG